MNSYSEKMLTAIENEDLVEAHLMLEQALQNDSSELLESLGNELLFMGFLVEAQQIFEQLVALSSFEDRSKIALAEIAIENNEIDQAFEYLESISSESTHYVEALLVEADLYQLLEIPEVSEQKLNNAKAILPNERLLDFALAELFF